MRAVNNHAGFGTWAWDVSFDPSDVRDILQRHAAEIAALMGPRAEVVEFGAGSLRKVRLLLDAMQAPARYLPIDISAQHLAQSAVELQRAYPGGETPGAPASTGPAASAFTGE